MVKRPVKCHIGPSDRGGAGAAISLDYITIETNLAFPETIQPDDRT
jgi:hypothetical protein